MAPSNFAARTREHTFTTERSATLRESLSYLWVMTRMAQEGDDLATLFATWMDTGDASRGSPAAALAMHNVLIQEMWVQPRVLVAGVDTEPLDGYGEEWCWLHDLTDEELTETIELASAGVRQAAGFPGGADGADGGADGADVVGAAKPAARPAARKRGSRTR